MAKKTDQQINFASWAEAAALSASEIKAAWEDLHRRRLVTVKRGHVTVSPLARATQT